MTILITGANGTISSALLALLASSSDAKLRALVRDPAKAPGLPGVEVAVGDLERPGTLTEAFCGLDTLWLLTAAGPQAPHASSNAVWAAERRRRPHRAAVGDRRRPRRAQPQRAAARPLRRRTRRVRDRLYHCPAVRVHAEPPRLGIGRDALHNWGQGRVGFIDTRDIAAFAAYLLTRPAEHAGMTYNLTGPASLSIADVAAALTQALGTAITAREIPDAAAVAAMTAAGLPEWVAEVAGREYAAGWGDYTTVDSPPSPAGPPGP